jgi:tetratricopeptide (TPR) repeat protein
VAEADPVAGTVHAEWQMADLSPEIQKLAEKVQKDPTSRLFFPLAEEYLKSGFLEEAVIVLTEGLKRHPDYLSARVVLGKAYYEQGKQGEARHEFEEVLKINPDNLLAMRKLAAIYLQDGRLEEARRYSDALLSGNPKDAEMRQLLQQVEQAQAAAPPASSVPPPTEPAVNADASPAREVVGETESLLQSSQHPPQSSNVPTGGEAAETEEDALGSPTLAQLYLDQGHYDQAVRIYDDLLRRDPQNETLQQARLNALALQAGTAAGAPPGDDVNAGEQNPAITRLEQWLARIEQRRRAS